MKVNGATREFILNRLSKNKFCLYLLKTICLLVLLGCIPLSIHGEITSNAKVATTVSITSPSNNTTLSVGYSVVVKADASSLQGNITLVEFFSDGQKIGQDATSPYEITYVVVAGSHTITATAMDALGFSGTSAGITVIGRNPKGGTRWPIPGKIEAENYDIGGQGLTYNDLSGGNSGGVFRTDDVDIVPTTDDGGGYTVTSTQSGEWMEYAVNVTTASQYILRTRVSALVAGKRFHVEMDGVDISGPILVPVTGNLQTFYQVDVYSTPLTVGQKFMRVVIDSGGFNLNNVSFLFNQAPITNIASPLNGATYTAPATITINVNAYDFDSNIAKVEFFNGGFPLYTDYFPPYSYDWINVMQGTYNITVKTTDQYGASSSSMITVFVLAANNPPTAYLTSPGSNITITPGSPLLITATASDIDGTVKRVEFVVAGPNSHTLNKTIIETTYISPYKYDWTSYATPGVYYLRAIAYDMYGAPGASQTILVTIENPNQPPLISITSPSNNSTQEKGNKIMLAADASDPDGSIEYVEFFLNGNSLGNDLTLPYQVEWSPTVLGACSITAKAKDNKGAITTSAVLDLTVLEAEDPFRVVITSPANDESFNPGQNITIAADVFSGGSIDKVEFYIGAEKIGDAHDFPYNFIWKTKPGNHIITAKAVRSVGGDAVSPAVNISVDIIDGVFDPISKPLNLSAFPNPFGSSTTVLVTLRQSGETSLIVYDLLGKEIAVLANEFYPTAEHQFNFDTKNILSGIYFIRLVSNGVVEVRSVSKE